MRERLGLLSFNIYLQHQRVCPYDILSILLCLLTLFWAFIEHRNLICILYSMLPTTKEMGLTWMMVVGDRVGRCAKLTDGLHEMFEFWVSGTAQQFRIPETQQSWIPETQTSCAISTNHLAILHAFPLCLQPPSLDDLPSHSLSTQPSIVSRINIKNIK
jgi:hypothetical protein